MDNARNKKGRKMKQDTLSVRMNADLRQRLSSVSEATRISEADLVRSCLEALVAQYDEFGYIVCPFRVCPDITCKQKTAALLRVAAEGKEYPEK